MTLYSVSAWILLFCVAWYYAYTTNSVAGALHSSPHASGRGQRMILFVKKAGGLALVLVGGLMAAHGGSAHEMWELLAGLVLVMIGAAILVMKILHRNPTRTDL
jgi:hypothetical protein